MNGRPDDLDVVVVLVGLASALTVLASIVLSGAPS